LQIGGIIWIRILWGKREPQVYIRRGCKKILNFQNVNGKAKPYQVRQFIRIIEKYSLLEVVNEE